MKKYTRIFALVLVFALAMTTVGCLVDKNKPADGADATTAPSASADTLDEDAIAIELGSTKITAGEVSDTYSYYQQMASYSGTTVDLATTLEDVISYHLPQYMAEQMGVTLSEDELAAVETQTQEQVTSTQNDTVCYYAQNYGSADASITEISGLSDEELSAAMDQINTELAQYYGDDYTFDDYMSNQYDGYYQNYLIDALSAKLRANNDATVTIDDAAVTAWYEATLAQQQTSFDATPTSYRDQVNGFASGSSALPALYVPAGFANVQIIKIAPSAELDATYDTNVTEMTALEAEYGKLALTGEDTARQAEIKTRYAELVLQNEGFLQAYAGIEKARANDAYLALQNGTSFEEVMTSYNTTAATESDLAGVLMYIGGEDSLYDASLCTAVAALTPGAYTSVIEVDNTFYIVRLVSLVEAGTIAQADNAEAIQTAALIDAQDTSWDELSATWLTQAKSAAIYHEDTYASLLAE